MPLDAVVIGGLPFRPIRKSQLVNHVVSTAAKGRGGWIVTANTDFLHKAAKSPALRGLLARADLIVADGTPILWLSRLLGRPLPERVTGADLLPTIAKEAARRGVQVILIGGEDERVLANALGRLNEDASARVTGYSPPKGYERSVQQSGAIRRAIETVGSDNSKIIFVGLGFPKQEQLIDSLRREFPNDWFIGVGASINFMGERFQRAPNWMCRLGFEWLHRLYSEPRRMFRRYLVDDLPFLILTSLKAIHTRRQTRIPDGPRAS